MSTSDRIIIYFFTMCEQGNILIPIFISIYFTVWVLAAEPRNVCTNSSPAAFWQPAYFLSTVQIIKH